MASRVRTSHQEKSGSGGKILNGRRYRQPFSPYNRTLMSSAPLALPAPEPDARRSPSWLRGLISGAGKLISSVLGSEGSGSSPSECSSDYSSDEDYNLHPYEPEDRLFSDCLTEFKKRESVVEDDVGSLAIVSKSESKLVIEQLLMQESFTRAEYIKFTDILRSRVLGSPSAEGPEGFKNEVPKRVSDSRPWHSLNQKRNFSGASNISPTNPSSFSPRYYAGEAITPDLRNEAVMEAKKWFEQKKLSPSPICDKDCGPCILNTDMNQHFDVGDGSPIEMAKSYLQSLPPWRSPSFSTVGFKNPPSSGKLSYSTGSHLLSASKAKKGESWDAKGDSRVSMKSIYNEQKRSKLRQAGSAPRPSILEPYRPSSAPTNLGTKVRDESLKVIDRNTVEIGHQMEMKEMSKPESLPMVVAVDVNEHLNSNIVTRFSSDAGMAMLNKNQVVDGSFPPETQIGDISAPQNSLVLISAAVGNGDSFTETGTFQPENAVSAEPSVHKSCSELKFQADNAIEMNPASGFKREQSFSDSKPAVQKDSFRAAEKIHINGHFKKTNNMNSDFKSMSNGDPTAANSGNGGGSVHVSISEGTRGALSVVSGDISVTRVANNNATKLQNENKRKSIEQTLAEPSVYGRGKRRAKKVVKQKRWKG